ncbi:MAG TPA: MarR family transcriptional regulator [Rhodoblastus sp.]|nr:MarR family transcriptional regulator [Rhodoblastus sp.]
MARPAKGAARMEVVAGSDFETRGADAGRGDLRLWLRILTIHKLVNNEVRRRLREQFGMSLSRFDLLAQLDGCGAGMRMGELSKRLMVTTGNITGLVDELVAEGLVERLPDPTNRRASLAAMTPRGRKAFGAAAQANEAWIEDMFAGLTGAEKAALFDMLGRQKADIATRLQDAGAPESKSTSTPKGGRR